ncbi:MAG: alpha/beta fold hydrolase [Elusimicrobia bacterium]|nr:alpha/beta fold hydrolase [Elusimicrobiota bacterium]
MLIDSVTFKVKGEKRVGVRFAPENARKKCPALLMLHGFPGAEKNYDLARALAAKGWVCLAPNFRGSWGSHGYYSFSGILEDAGHFWNHLRRDPLTDKNRMAVLGLSMGGWAALNFAGKLGTDTSSPKAVVAVVPMAGSTRWFHPGARKKLLEFSRILEIHSAQELWQDFKTALFRNDPLEDIDKISPIPLLLVHGTKDELVPYSLTQELFKRAKEPKRFVTIKGADHQFSEHRPQLIKTVIAWLTHHVAK